MSKSEHYCTTEVWTRSQRCSCPPCHRDSLPTHRKYVLSKQLQKIFFPHYHFTHLYNNPKIITKLSNMIKGKINRKKEKKNKGEEVTFGWKAPGIPVFKGPGPGPAGVSSEGNPWKLRPGICWERKKKIYHKIIQSSK